MDRRSSAHCCCRHHRLFHTLRSRLCSALSLPTVNASTMYRRLTPTEITSRESSEETLKENLEMELKQNDENESLSIADDEIQDTLGERETGWDRIRQAFTLNPESKFMPTECFELSLLSIVSFGMGFMYGGLPASYKLRNRYMETSQGAAYETRFHAVSDSYNAGTRGLVRYGVRWGWRVAFIATSFHGISTCLSLYRNKVDMVNFGIAAFTTGAIYRFNMGLTGMVGGGVAGLVVGVPAGIFIILTQKLSGVTSLERARQHRAEHIIKWKKELTASGQENTDAIDYMDKWLRQKERESDNDNDNDNTNS